MKIIIVVLAAGSLLLTGMTLHASDSKSVEPAWKMPPHEWFLKQVPPPPSADSEAGRRDLAEVIRQQNAASPEEIARAQWTYKMTIFTFGEALDKRFTPANFPKTEQFFLELNNLCEKENSFLKNYFRRPHPFQLDPAHVRCLIVPPAGFSYPGYHTTRCVVFVNVLSILDPADKDAFQQVAKQIEVDRTLAGEHYPSDIDGGKKLGTLIYAELVRDKGFLTAVQELKAAEWTPPPSTSRHLHIPVP